MNNGLLFIVSAPSGCGKDTLLARMRELYDDVAVSISATTRPRREGETDGVDYHFVTRDKFLEMAENKELLEYAVYNGQYYGTVRRNVERLMAEGKNVILKIEVQGAEQIRACGDFVTSVFLLPPSMRVLEHRLRKRNSDSEEHIRRRLAIAGDEMRGAMRYDYILINDDVDTAAEQLMTIIRAQRFRRENMQKKWEEVIDNAEI